MSDRPAFETIALPLFAYEQIKRDEAKTDRDESAKDLNSKIKVLLTAVSLQQDKGTSLRNRLDTLEARVEQLELILLTT